MKEWKDESLGSAMSQISGSFLSNCQLIVDLATNFYLSLLYSSSGGSTAVDGFVSTRMAQKHSSIQSMF